MSDLRPTGVPIELGSVERHFLFTLNVIDEIQTHYDGTVLDALGHMFSTNDKEPVSDVIFFATVLMNDEAERESWRNSDSQLKKVTEKEAGWMITWDNLNEVRTAILQAYHISMPEAEDNDPNRESGRQNR